MRVHELAKEMDKTNKEVLDVLKEKNIEVKSHMSSLSDEEINTVKKSFDEKGGKDEKTSEDTQKKKHIVQVFRPQNSKNAGKMGSNRNGKAGGNRDGRQNQGNKQAFHKEKAERTERQERPAQDNSQVKKSLTNNAAPKRKERRDDNRRDDRRDNRRDDRRGDRRDNRRDDNRRDDRRDNRRDDRRGDRRDDNRRDDRRNAPSIPAPIMPEQGKPQRQKPKDKDAYKKKDYRQDDMEDGKGKTGKQAKKGKPAPAPVKPQPKKEEKVEEKIKMITLPEVITIKELAEKMKIQPSAIVKKLFLQGKIVTVNQEVDFETAEEIAMEFEVLCEKEERSEEHTSELQSLE